VKVRIANTLFQSDPAAPQFLLELVNDYYNLDNYLFFSYTNVSSNGIHPESISLQLDDPTIVNLSSTDLLSTAPYGSAWSQSFGLTITGYGNGYQPRADLSMFEVASECEVAVPRREHPDRKVQWPPQGRKGRKGRRDRKGRKELRARRVPWNRKGPRVRRARPDRKDHKACQGQEVRVSSAAHCSFCRPVRRCRPGIRMWEHSISRPRMTGAPAVW
jgi:hypothetical protein